MRPMRQKKFMQITNKFKQDKHEKNTEKNQNFRNGNIYPMRNLLCWIYEPGKTS